MTHQKFCIRSPPSSSLSRSLNNLASPCPQPCLNAPPPTAPIPLPTRWAQVSLVGHVGARSKFMGAYRRTEQRVHGYPLYSKEVGGETHWLYRSGDGEGCWYVTDAKADIAQNRGYIRTKSAADLSRRKRRGSCGSTGMAVAGTTTAPWRAPRWVGSEGARDAILARAAAAAADRPPLAPTARRSPARCLGTRAPVPLTRRLAHSHAHAPAHASPRSQGEEAGRAWVQEEEERVAAVIAGAPSEVRAREAGQGCMRVTYLHKTNYNVNF